MAGQRRSRWKESMGVAKGIYYDKMSVAPETTATENNEEDAKTGKPLMDSTKRSGYWTRIKKKWNRKGVVEIDVDNERYVLLNCIREGLRELLQNHPELGPKDNLTVDDYNHVLEKSIRAKNGKEVQFCSYGSSVFATIRQAIGLSELEFIESVAPDHLPYLQFMSNSKGGQLFFLTNDKAYFMKTEKLYYVNYFRSILGTYLEHFLDYPHSLIVKYLGLYSVKVPGQGAMYFYIMQSIFYPEERIDIRYDIKGCLAGRHEKPPEEDSKVLTVYKDKNFVDENENIEVGEQRQWLIEQLKKDAEFLGGLGVQDYSLLVGIHKLHKDEKEQDLGDIVTRVKKSLGRQESSGAMKTEAKSWTKAAQKASYSTQTSTGTAEVLIEEKSDAVSPLPAPKQRSGKGIRRGRISFIDRSTSQSEKETTGEASAQQNRRLLPNTKNPLHIIDGRENRYYLGIIDFFTLYECRQRTGRMLKNVKFMCADHSTVPPGAYATRFINFLSDHIK